jgi:hypothetical protein
MALDAVGVEKFDGARTTKKKLFTKALMIDGRATKT